MLGQNKCSSDQGQPCIDVQQSANVQAFTALAETAHEAGRLTRAKRAADATASVVVPVLRGAVLLWRACGDQSQDQRACEGGMHPERI